MRKNLILFAAAVTLAWAPGCLFGAPKVSSLAGVLIEEGYTPLTLKRAGNEFYVSCKLNGRSASLIVDYRSRPDGYCVGTAEVARSVSYERRRQCLWYAGVGR
jgi:hypothetical protein